MGNSDVRDRLRRLGVVRGAEHLPQPARRQPQAIQDLLPGEMLATERGTCFLHRESYPLNHLHGRLALSALLAHTPITAAQVARDERLAAVDLNRLAFIDTETTGLAGGTGTYAFLVGVGVFEDESLTIYQFFMCDYDQEPAQLHALARVLDGLQGLVSFNGKSFDLPLLETRFIMARQEPRLVGAPHLDLLSPARRVWKHRLESCALSRLEQEVLGVERQQQDVPGWLIPAMYVDYVRSGDAREMPRIFYHNAQDILSLVVLAARLCDLVGDRLREEQDLPVEDLYGLGRLLQDLGQGERAEAAFAQSAESCSRQEVAELAMRDLATLLKRQERREEAAAWWQKLALERRAVYACEELAKHYEWHAVDLRQALAWTEEAQALVGRWPPGPERRQALAELEHRLERLSQKLRRAP